MISFDFTVDVIKSVLSLSVFESLPLITPASLTLSKEVDGRTVMSEMSENFSPNAFTSIPMLPVPMAVAARILNSTLCSLFGLIVTVCCAALTMLNVPERETFAVASAGREVVFDNVTGMTSVSLGLRNLGMLGLMTIGSATFMCLSALPNA